MVFYDILKCVTTFFLPLLEHLLNCFFLTAPYISVCLMFKVMYTYFKKNSIASIIMTKKSSLIKILLLNQLECGGVHLSRMVTHTHTRIHARKVVW